jgi:hypothetical protein
MTHFGPLPAENRGRQQPSSYPESHDGEARGSHRNVASHSHHAPHHDAHRTEQCVHCKQPHSASPPLKHQVRAQCKHETEGYDGNSQRH